jgi:DNA-directed RNA polymerase subunit delta
MDIDQVMEERLSHIGLTFDPTDESVEGYEDDLTNWEEEQVFQDGVLDDEDEDDDDDDEEDEILEDEEDLEEPEEE